MENNTLSLPTIVLSIRAVQPPPRLRHPDTMESFSDPQVYASFFCNQTIFLTGATGGLGGCLLYKLALALPTQRIYVLVRSEAKARKTWRKTMPNQIGAILEDSDRVKLVVGDILKPNFGIEPDMLEEIEAQTTLIVHSVWVTAAPSYVV